MRAPSLTLIDRLAAEYVVGTLRGPARRRFGRWLDGTAPGLDDGAAARSAVRRWEDRLAPFADTAARIDPSPRVWQEIQRRIAPTAARRGRWQPLALAASVLVVAFGLWLAVDSRKPGPQWQLAAELRTEAGSSLQWRIDYDPATNALRLVALAPPTLPPGSVHELWALAEGAGAPVSLGLLPQSGALERPLAAAQRLALRGAGKLAVSREPAGGSPTGAPTGPVLLVAPRGSIVGI